MVTLLNSGFVDALARGEFAVVLGGALRRELGVSPLGPDPAEFVDALAAEAEFAEEERRWWPHVAHAVMGLTNRAGLATKVRDAFGSLPPPPSIPSLQALLALRPRLVCTTWYDDTVLDLLGVIHPDGVSAVTGPEAAAYIGKNETSTVLYLMGRASEPASLALGSADYDSRFDRSGRIAQVIDGVIATNTLIFLGFTFADWCGFEDFYSRFINIPTDRHTHLNFLLTSSSPTPRCQRRLRDLDLTILVSSDPASYLLSACDHAQAKALTHRPIPPSASVGGAPYRYLNPYSAQDRELFCGREQATDALFKKVMAHRYVVVFGASGVGKTSLLNAGVGPKLGQQGYRFLNTRVLPSPGRAVLQALARRTDPSDATWLEALETLGDIGRHPTVVSFDQFEEFFTELPPAEKRQFWSEVERATRDYPDRFKLIFSIRQDALYQLNEAFPALPQPFATTFGLDSLSDADREEAIKAPAVLVGRPWDAPFVARLIDDFRAAAGETAHLSIVLTTVWEARGEGLSDLEVYESLGGTRRILETYLWDVLEQHPDKDRLLQVLKAFVSPERRKSQISSSDIHLDLSQLGIDSTDTEAHDLCQYLVNARFLRSVPLEERVYELSHDVLAAAIGERLTEQDRRRKQAKRAVRDRRHDWMDGLGMPRADAYEVLLRDAKLAPLSPDEIMFVTQCVAHAGGPVDEWLERCVTVGGIERHAAVMAIVSSESVQGAHEALSRLDTAEVDECLAILDSALQSCYPSVRMHAVDLLDLHPALTSGRQVQGDVLLADHVYVPSGPFLMGYSPTPLGANARLMVEPHEVHLDDYWMDRFLVTNHAYARFLAATGHAHPPEWESRAAREGRAYHPVTHVTWEDASAYAEWRGGDLPTEAQWEKAVYWDPSSQTKLPFPWGTAWDVSRANIYDSQLGSTSPVGAFSPRGDSPYGIADAVGNVFVWCRDDAEYPLRPRMACRNPVVQVRESHAFKMARGGSYGGPAAQCHATSREYSRARHVADFYVGFRCVYLTRPSSV